MNVTDVTVMENERRWERERESSQDRSISLQPAHASKILPALLLVSGHLTWPWAEVVHRHHGSVWTWYTLESFKSVHVDNLAVLRKNKDLWQNQTTVEMRILHDDASPIRFLFLLLAKSHSSASGVDFLFQDVPCRNNIPIFYTNCRWQSKCIDCFRCCCVPRWWRHRSDGSASSSCERNGGVILSSPRLACYRVARYL